MLLLAFQLIISNPHDQKNLEPLIRMSFITEDQLKILQKTVKCLKKGATDGEKNVQEVTFYNYENYSFNLINFHGLKHLLQLNETMPNYSSILDSTTDLVPDIYEGGFKLWECSTDLLQYLSSNDIIEPGHTVCDLGCGSGILGIYALQKKASSVHFLDYNEEVLRWFTLPNILSNLTINSSEELSDTILKHVLKKSNFYPGDWGNVDKELNDIKYDVILTSETIYKKKNYTKLLNLMKNHLKSNGKILVAAKVFYFGLDGGCFDFIKFVEKDGSFNVRVVKRINDNLHRNILLLTFR